MKFIRINKVVVNSQFTKSFIDKEYPIDSKVIYPPVDVKKFKGGKKENLIVYVGRFSQLEQSKRQDVLVRAFKNFYDSLPKDQKDWKLVLAGGSEVGRTEYVDRLKANARTYPIKIVENPHFPELKQLYSKAKIFWSASGYGVNEAKEPNKVEHFGITTVEAMSAGVIPVVYRAGGSKEIVADGENGYLWTSTKGLIGKTLKIVYDEKLARKLAARAKADSQKYSYERFERGFLSLL